MLKKKKKSNWNKGGEILPNIAAWDEEVELGICGIQLSICYGWERFGDGKTGHQVCGNPWVRESTRTQDRVWVLKSGQAFLGARPPEFVTLILSEAYPTFERCPRPKRSGFGYTELAALDLCGRGCPRAGLAGGHGYRWWRRGDASPPQAGLSAPF